MPVRVVQRVGVALCLFAPLAPLAACDQSSDDPTEGDGREAAVYELILDWVLAGEPAAADDEPTVFVASRHEQPIDVEVQALIVEAMDERAEVRFVDERAEAVVDGEDGLPVHDGGVLVGLGAVPPDGDRVEVYVDRYRRADDVVAWDVTVQRRGESWQLAGEPAAADVRPVLDGD